MWGPGVELRLADTGSKRWASGQPSALLSEIGSLTDLETASSPGQQTPGILLLPPLPVLGLQVYSTAFILYIGAGD